MTVLKKYSVQPNRMSDRKCIVQSKKQNDFLRRKLNEEDFWINHGTHNNWIRFLRITRAGYTDNANRNNREMTKDELKKIVQNRNFYEFYCNEERRWSRSKPSWAK